jgi:hypothetical protein
MNNGESIDDRPDTDENATDAGRDWRPVEYEKRNVEWDPRIGHYVERR